MSVVINLWVSSWSIRPFTSPWLGVTNCYDLLLTSLVPDDGKHTNLHNCGANIVHNMYPQFLLHFQKQWEDLVIMFMVMQTFKCGLTNLLLGARNWKFESMPVDCFLLWIQITVTLRGRWDLVKQSSGQWYKLLCTSWVVDCLSTAIYGCKDSTMLNLGFSLEYSPSQPWVIH